VTVLSSKEARAFRISHIDNMSLNLADGFHMA